MNRTTKHLCLLFAFGKKSKENTELTQYAGMCYECLGSMHDGSILYSLHNRDYCPLLIEKYKKSKVIGFDNLIKTLKEYNSQMDTEITN